MNMESTVASLMSPLSQTARLLRLHTALGEEVLVPEQLCGWESVDEGGFRFELTALSADAQLDLASLLGQPVLLELLTAQSRVDLRPFHGQVAVFEREGSNAGLARYRLVIEPWLAFLRQRRDSYVFQDRTVMDIVDEVLGDYVGRGALEPAWRWNLADPSIYARRSLTTQYQESDFAFVSRLLAEEGLYYWFEHEGDLSAERFGRHVLVIADHMGAFTPSDGDGEWIRFHRADASETEDSIQHWQLDRRWPVTRVARSSWDYRTRSTRPAAASAPATANLPLADDDPAGPYAWHDTAEGQRRAERQLEAFQVEAHTISGGGTVRTLAPGRRFVLTEHAAYPDPEAARFVTLRVQHQARNNLQTDVFSFSEQPLPLQSSPAGWPAALAPLSRIASPDAAEQPGAIDPQGYYQNRFQVIPAERAYRPQTVDGHGLRRHPKPSVHGTQSAIVVGDGGPVHTDRDHRIKIQFHWQRGAVGSGGQPRPDGADNAPASAALGAWVRVMSTLAGENFGQVMIPRVGQEVAVDFLEGDIDRPVVVGVLYNGRGNADAPHNQVSAGGSGATGNAAPWFAGNEHAAVFSGIKTQSLSASQDGTGGYNLLRFDDTPGQLRLQLGTTQQHSVLTLGHLKGGQDNRREGDRGFGAELSTTASGALRAGAGLLLTTESGRQQLHAPQLQGQLQNARQLLDSLADVSQQQGAGLPGEPAPQDLPASRALQGIDQALQARIGGSAAADGIDGGAGEVPAFGTPLLGISGIDGINAVTPQSQIWVAGTQASLTAALDLSLIAQGASTMTVAGGIGLYTHGVAANPNKPNPETGIALHAATGPVSVQVPASQARFAAEQAVTVASTEADVRLTASKQLLLTAAGAYLKLEGDNIELGAPGTVAFKASMKELAGGQSASGEAIALTTNDYEGCSEALKTAAQEGGASVYG